MAGGKLYIEIGLVMVLGMMCLSTPLTTTFASASASAPAPAPAPAPDSSMLAKTLPCWDKIVWCVNATFNETSLLDLTEPTFNASHVLCCSVIQQQMKDDKQCFCRGADIIVDYDNSHVSSFNQVLSICNITSPLNALCSGASGQKIGWALLLSLLFIVSTTFTF